jgi:predicted Zn-dependent protease
LELHVPSTDNSIAGLEQRAVDLARRGAFGVEGRDINQELTQRAPDNPGAWTRFARCCLELGELAAANSALESALTLDPRNNIARSLLQEVVRRELLASMPAEPPVRTRKSRAKKADPGE